MGDTEEVYTILVDFFLLDSVHYRDDVMTTLKFDWSNIKILMSGWYRKLTSSCVSFTIYQQCHTDIEGDVTPISLQYQNVHWAVFICDNFFLSIIISENLTLQQNSFRWNWMPEQTSGLLIHVTGTPPWLLRLVNVSTSSELYSDCFRLPTFLDCLGIQFFDSPPFSQHS